MDRDTDILIEIREALRQLPEQLVAALGTHPDAVSSPATVPPPASEDGERPWYDPKSPEGSQIAALENLGAALGRFAPPLGELAGLSRSVRGVFGAFDDLDQSQDVAPTLSPEIAEQGGRIRAQDPGSEVRVKLPEPNTYGLAHENGERGLFDEAEPPDIPLPTAPPIVHHEINDDWQPPAAPDLSEPPSPPSIYSLRPDDGEPPAAVTAGTPSLGSPPETFGLAPIEAVQTKVDAPERTALVPTIAPPEPLTPPTPGGDQSHVLPAPLAPTVAELTPGMPGKPTVATTQSEEALPPLPATVLAATVAQGSPGTAPPEPAPSVLLPVPPAPTIAEVAAELPTTLAGDFAQTVLAPPEPPELPDTGASPDWFSFDADADPATTLPDVSPEAPASLHLLGTSLAGSPPPGDTPDWFDFDGPSPSPSPDHTRIAPTALSPLSTGEPRDGLFLPPSAPSDPWLSPLPEPATPPSFEIPAYRPPDAYSEAPELTAAGSPASTVLRELPGGLPSGGGDGLADVLREAMAGRASGETGNPDREVSGKLDEVVSVLRELLHLQQADEHVDETERGENYKPRGMWSGGESSERSGPDAMAQKVLGVEGPKAADGKRGFIGTLLKEFIIKNLVK